MAGCYVVFHKQLGDLLLLQPALARIAAHFGGPVRVMTRSGHRALLGLMPGVEYAAGLPLHPCRKLFAFDPLGKTAARSLLAPALEKVCILPDRDEAGPWLPFVYRRMIVPGLGPEYIAQYFWKRVPCGGGEVSSPPRLEAPPSAWRPSGIEEGDGFVLVNPTAGWRRKSWRAAGWAAVIRGLLEAGVPRVCVTSGRSDWQLAHQEEIRALVDDPRLVVQRDLSLESYLWLCSRARMTLAVDGAAGHLTAAFGAPTVTLFGPTDRNHWHWPGPRAVALQGSVDKDGVARTRNIPETDVLEAALRLLRESA